jgi:hypothetical protein
MSRLYKKFKQGEMTGREASIPNPVKDNVGSDRRIPLLWRGAAIAAGWF